jgi:replicative DNA helicase
MNARAEIEDDAVAHLRKPPHSLEAEQSVLGGLLLDNTAWDRAGDLLAESDFYRFEHRHIYGAIGALVCANKPADVITVYEQLERAGKAKECGGMSYLNALSQSVPSAANIRRYAEIVRERSVLRSIIAASDEAATLAFSGGGSASELLAKITAKFDGIERRTVRQDPKPLHELLMQRVEHYSALAEGSIEAGWPTRVEKLDAMLNGGLRPGHMVVLAARPKVGKTSFAMEIAISVAEQGLPVLALTQEMSAGELTDRIVSRMGGIDGGHLQTGKLGAGEWERLTAAVDRGSRLPIEIDDQPALTISDIRAKARSTFKASNQRKGGLLVVDYLQLTAGSSDKGDRNRNNEIEEVSRGIKALAKQLGVCVLALSQLNRKVEERANKRPYLGDLRDSGAIEQDADAVIFLWPFKENLKGGALRVVGLDLAANRHGGTGEFGLDFWKAYQRWEESDMSIEPPTATEQRGNTKGFE